MAVTATAGRARIVHPGAANEGRRCVAEMAVHRRRQVRTVHTCRGCTVMTGRAVIHDAGVIEYRTDEARRVMTDDAILVGRHVADRLAERERVVVAGAAVIHDTGGVEACGQEPGRHVTYVAVLVGRHVIGRRRLARRSCTVVT